MIGERKCLIKSNTRNQEQDKESIPNCFGMNEYLGGMNENEKNEKRCRLCSKDLTQLNLQNIEKHKGNLNLY